MKYAVVLCVLLVACTKTDTPQPNVFHIEHRIHTANGSDQWDIYPVNGVQYRWKDSTLSFLCNGRYILGNAQVGDTIHAGWWNGSDYTTLKR